MKFRAYHRFVFILCLGLPLGLRSQQMNLRTWSVEAGLPQSQVFALLQDQRGLLWIGTWGGGLSVFDGISFRNFSAEDSLPGNKVRCLAEDSTHSLIWAGTDEGLAWYDGIRFHTLSLTSEKTPVNGILLDEHSDKIYIAADKGLYEGSLQNGFKAIRLPEPAGKAKVYALYRDAGGRIWAGTDYGLFIRENKNWIRISKKNGLGANEVRGISHDRKGRIWIATYGGGVSFSDSHTYIGDSTFMFRTLDKSKGLSDDIVFSVMEDHEGRMWFATLEGGACRLDPQGFTQIGEQQGLQANHVRCFVEDRWGNVWIGTSGGGLSRFGGDRFTHLTEKSGLPGVKIYALAEADSAALWLATDKGGITHYSKDSVYTWRKNEGISDAVVKVLFRDADNSLWIGSEGDGLFHLTNTTIEHFSKEEGLKNPFVKDILRDGKGRLWIATAGGGLFLKSTEAFENFREKEGLISDRFNCLFAQGNTLWAGSANKGISWLQENGRVLKNFGLTEGLCNEDVREICSDRKGRIWIATAGGLASILTKKGNGDTEVHCFGRKDGLASENLYLLIADTARNELIAGSEQGIDVISLGDDGMIRQIRHYGGNEGFSGIETCQRAVMRAANGSVWFGTLRGATCFNAGENKGNRIPPVTSITGVKVLYEDAVHTKWAKGFIPHIGIPEQLELPWDKNLLTFSFRGINFSSPEKVLYRWRLIGLDENWSAPGANREAIFTNLKPGDYVFEVMAENEDGVWSAEPARFAFRILAPWWATWWFRVLLALSVIALIVLVFRIRLQQVRNKGEAARMKLETEKQMLELEQKALRLQMNPHFIFNALNSIKGFVAQNDNATARQNITKFAQLMRLILDNSRAQRISLEKEIQTLTLYLELEKLNRDNSFTFGVECDAGLDPAITDIPPMIVQPFVENAVIHAMGPVGKGGEIAVRFQAEADHILCTVDDNGPGIQTKEEKEGHHSAGIEVTTQRLNLIDPRLKISFESPVAGKDSGTRVKIRLPLEKS